MSIGVYGVYWWRNFNFEGFSQNDQRTIVTILYSYSLGGSTGILSSSSSQRVKTGAVCVSDPTTMLLQVNTSLTTDLPDQLTSLEENLAANLAVTLRDDSRKNFEQVLEALEELEGKLHAVKKALKRSNNGAESGVGGAASNAAAGVSLDTVLERVVGVATRLETVQAAVEANITGAADGAAEKNGNSSSGNGLSMALLLGEVRKRADSESLALLSQDLMKSVHNVQKRLLEEHVSSSRPTRTPG